MRRASAQELSGSITLVAQPINLRRERLGAPTFSEEFLMAKATSKSATKPKSAAAVTPRTKTQIY